MARELTFSLRERWRGWRARVRVPVRPSPPHLAAVPPPR
jgi:hypothetical protein